MQSNMGKSGSSHFRDPPLISEETSLKSEAVLIKYLDIMQSKIRNRSKEESSIINLLKAMKKDQ